MRINWNRYGPPGLEIITERNYFLGGLGLSGVFSLGYLFKLAGEISDLYYYDGQIKILREGVVMPDFVEVLGNSLTGFWILCLCMLAVAAYHYASHWQGSKSIYVMRRLPKRMEMHRRCLTLPAVGVVVSVIAAFLVMAIYYGIYMLAVPEACLAPWQWQKIWAAIF